MFGTLADAEALIVEAHALSLRVMIDVVPNHTSSSHPWFAEALASPRRSAARARYVVRDGRGAEGDRPPNGWGSVFGGSAWTRMPDDGRLPAQWYLHLFDAAQPDLAWENPEVRAEFDSILECWLDRGVDGFRIDVAHFLVKDPALPELPTAGEPAPGEHPFADREDVHEVYRDWRRVVDRHGGDDRHLRRDRPAGRADRPLPASRRAPHRVQLRPGAAAVGGRAAPPLDRPDARLARRCRGARDVGAGQPRPAAPALPPGARRARRGARTVDAAGRWSTR